jgi:hypothetical protein
MTRSIRKLALGTVAAPGMRCASLLALILAPLVAATAQAEEAKPSDDPSGLVTLGRDLKLEVTEDGPDQPWTISLSNTGTNPIGIIADPGLLWFEVSVPGRAVQVCRLPEPLWPTAMQRRDATVLYPKEHFSRTFDPRFFCFSELGQTLLVPGARVTPRFGWPRETTSPSAQRRSTAKKPPIRGPFVAWPLPAEAGDAGNSPSATRARARAAQADSSAGAPAVRLPSEGLENVQGPTLELPASYSAWLGTPHGEPTDVQLVMIAGSDADDERNAIASFALVNATDHPQQIFVRREVVQYEVRGPDGYFVCPASDIGTPDLNSYATLPPHGAERYAVRLIEVCPRRSFSRPGLYEVQATLAAHWHGHDMGLDAFVGQLDSLRSSFVRIRSGDRSPFARALGPVGHAGDGSSPPSEGTRSPNDDAPDNANAPEESPPAPDAPAESPPPPAVE